MGFGDFFLSGKSLKVCLRSVLRFDFWFIFFQFSSFPLLKGR